MRLKCRLVALCLATVLGLAPAAEPPVTFRCEPPNWWAGHSVNPVRLLITGDHLEQASVAVAPPLKASGIGVSGNGNFLFCDLEVDPAARPGTYELGISTPGGRTSLQFPLLPAIDRERAVGITTDDVLYLIMPDRFANGDPDNDDPAISHGLFDRKKPRFYHGGDFAGVRSHLDYLRELGVTALWLTPWYENVNHPNSREKYTSENQRSSSGSPVTDYHGYGATDFYGVEEHFGSLEELRALVRRAHELGFKMVQDQVANHSSPYHPWVSNSPTPTWFNGTSSAHLDNTWQTWALTRSNAPQHHVKSTLEGWFLNILPDLNQNDPETATYLIQNSLWWVGVTGVDAIRQDTLPYVPRSYWSRWTTALKRQYPHLSIVGEMWDANPELVAFFQGGRARFDGVDSGVETLFDFPLHYAIRDVFGQHAPMTKLSKVFAADTNYVNPRGLVTFLGLHDVPRFLNMPGATVEDLQLAFTFLLTARGTPLIYYGDEVAMRGGGDPDNRRDFPGGWKDDLQTAFTREGRTAEQEQVHTHVAKLLRLRRQSEPLRRGAMTELQADAKSYAFARGEGESAMVVAFNEDSGSKSFNLSLPAGLSNVTGLKDCLGGLGNVAVLKGRATFELPARTACILAVQPKSEKVVESAAAAGK